MYGGRSHIRVDRFESRRGFSYESDEEIGHQEIKLDVVEVGCANFFVDIFSSVVFIFDYIANRFQRNYANFF